jgi:hypothetical protein
MTPDDIPLANPADKISGDPKADVPDRRRPVGPESETRGGPEAPDETLDDDLAGGPSDPPVPPGAPPEPPDPDKPPPVEEPPRPIPVPPDEPPPPLIVKSADSAGSRI